MSTDTKVLIGLGIVGVALVLVPIKAEQVRDCKHQDTIISIVDEYNGAWSGVDRNVYWRSGMKEITDNDNSKYYVGKEICREYKK